ncbi:MAG TPA: BACON domain-containing protein, partial [Bacteroidales bacterium]|nr:BACON domain-containing protein [Bacteroidales bacterium]
MKLKYFFPLFIAAVTLMVSCDDEFSETLLDEIQVSSSYVSIPIAGGSTSITVTANDSWTVENSLQWLTISSTSGSAGESTLSFSAESALDGR